MITKLDVTGSTESAERIARELGQTALCISAVTGQGIPELLRRIADRLDQLPAIGDDVVAPSTHAIAAPVEVKAKVLETVAPEASEG